MGRGSPAAAEHADRVRVIDHQPRTVLLAEGDDLRQGGDIALHAVEAIHHDELALVCRQLAQYPLQVLHVLVPEALGLAEAQLRAVDQARMVFLVQDDIISTADQRADRAQVGLHAGGEDQRRLFPDELRDLVLQLLVHLERAVQEAGAGAAGAVAPDRLDGRLADAGVGRQAQVVVRAAHDQAVALVQGLGAFVFAQGDEVGVHAGGNRLFGFGVFVRLGKKIHENSS